MRYWKRIPALLLALVMVLSCFATALAAEPEAEAYPIAPAADAKKEALVCFKSEEFRLLFGKMMGMLKGRSR